MSLSSTHPSAAQAISPAIERTKQYLFRPFRLGRFFKLTLVALLVEGGATSFNFGGGNFPSGSGSHSGSTAPWHMPVFHWPTMGQWLVVGVVAALIVLPILLLVSYLLIRLRFSFFDCVLRQRDHIGTAWAIYHRQALRYLGLMWVIGLGFWMVLIPVGIALYQHFKPLLATMGNGQPFNPWSQFPLIAIIVPLTLLLAIVGGMIETMLGGFVLSRMALEDATIGEALGDVWGDFQAEPGQFVLFAFLRYLLCLAGSIVGGIAIALPLVLVVAIGAVIVFAAKAASTSAALVFGIPLEILVLSGFLIAVAGLSGTLGTFRGNYALLSYGGRYPLLGSMLYPQMLPSAAAWQPGFVPPPNPISGV